MASENSGGIQYALTALGVGMLALGILMMVWSVVPGFGKEHEMQGGNNSSSNAEQSKHKVSQVSYILCAGGVFLLLLSICLSVREKRRRPQEEVTNVQSESSILPERVAENNNRLAVPSYDEVMQRDGIVPLEGPEANLGEQNMVSLPSYESLVEVGLPSSSNQDSNPRVSVEPPRDERPTSHLGQRFSSKKIRRILSDTSHLKRFRLNLSNTNNPAVNLEPLTPPPQYEEGMEKSFENASAKPS